MNSSSARRQSWHGGRGLKIPSRAGVLSLRRSATSFLKLPMCSRGDPAAFSGSAMWRLTNAAAGVRRGGRRGRAGSGRCEGGSSYQDRRGVIQLLMRYFDASSPVNWHAPASPAFQPDF